MYLKLFGFSFPQKILLAEYQQRFQHSGKIRVISAGLQIGTVRLARGNRRCSKAVQSRQGTRGWIVEAIRGTGGPPDLSNRLPPEILPEFQVKFG